MTITIQAPIDYKSSTCDSVETAKRWLVQIHPIDLERGPMELKGDTMDIGRSSDCHIHIEDNSVSRLHAEIRLTAEEAELIDRNSTNGVLVNNIAVERTLLRSGDRIQLGARVFRFLADNDFESQYHETVYSMMTRDGLTGSYNKRYLMESLKREMNRCNRFQRPIAVALIDIDHFKAINDKHGHFAGDDVLKELTSRLHSTLRDDEILSRFGGEEFAIVMVEAKLEQAIAVAERCRIAVERDPFRTSVGPINVTISAGVCAPALETLSQPESLLEMADCCLYEAKRAGRNRVVA